MRLLSLAVALILASVANAQDRHPKKMPVLPAGPSVVITTPTVVPATPVVVAPAAPTVVISPRCPCGPGGCPKPTVRVRVGLFRVFVR